MLKTNFLSLLIFLFLFTSNVFSQNKPKAKNESESIRLKTNVMVLDSNNQYASGLKREDFQVFEDGVEQTITQFEEIKPILHLGIIVDNSGSMRYSLREIIWAASFVVKNLREKDEAFAVRFVSSDKIETLQEWTSDKTKLIKTLQNMYIEGGNTAVLDAIYLSAQKLGERAKDNKGERYALLLISDVEERNSYYDFEQTLKQFENLRSQLFILSYAEKAPKKKKAKYLSHRLSLETGGSVYTLSKKHKGEELKKIVADIVFELRSNYTIGYTTTNQNRDGLRRNLVVKVANDGSDVQRKVLSKEGFTIPKSKK